MANNTSRLTNTGTLLVNGSLDEVTIPSVGSIPSAGSIQLNGSSQYLSFPGTGLTLSGANWTMEVYIYFTAYSASPYYAACVFGAVDTSNRGFSLYISGTSSSFTSLTAYGQVNISANYNFLLNTWYHLAVTHTAAGVWLIYINGVALSTTNTTAGTWNLITPYTIGYARPGYPYYFPGYISNFRLVIGTILYTGNFTPPNFPLTAVTNTQLLLNTPFNGNAFLDSSGNNVTITQVASPTSISANPFTGTIKQRILGDGTLQVFGGFDEVFMVPGSISLDGSTQYLSVPGTGLGLSGTNFTVECWVYLTAYAAAYSGYYTGCILSTTSTSGSSGGNFGLEWTIGGTISSYTSTGLYGNNGSVSFSGSYAFALNTWYHMALTHTAAGAWVIYVNGTSVATASNAATWTDNSPYAIGRNNQSGYNYYLPANVSNFRMTIGSLVYTGNFTPPNAPLIPAANTKLLLNTSYGTGAAFSDSSNNNITITQVSSPTSNNLSPFTINTVQRLLNTGTLQISGYFDEVTGF